MKSVPNPQLDLLARQWGATAVPFAQLTSEGWLETPDHQLALQRLEQTATLRSVMLLAGPNGVGKSALLGRWVQGLDPRRFHPVVLTHATLSGTGLLATLTAKLGQPAGYPRNVNLARIETALAELETRIPVLILDDAQNYTHATLEEVRLLLGLNLTQPPPFALILIGDEYLLSTLRLRHHRALHSRIGAHLSLGSWPPDQIAQYLQQGFASVGIQREAIQPAAVELLTRASGGIARSLCLLARAAWIAAATAGASLIDTDHVQQAIDTIPGAAGLQLPPPAQPEA